VLFPALIEILSNHFRAKPRHRCEIHILG
jgi:hypothetical protein